MRVEGDGQREVREEIGDGRGGPWVWMAEGNRRKAGPVSSWMKVEELESGQSGSSKALPTALPSSRSLSPH